MKDTNFGILLFFERLDDVRSFSITALRTAIVAVLKIVTTADKHTILSALFCRGPLRSVLLNQKQHTKYTGTYQSRTAAQGPWRSQQ